MLENIISTFFVKMVFFNIQETIKLSLIKYNKKLQNIININLNHYKKLCRRYIIFESKGKGKEYNKNNMLLYKGEFLHGKRNGRGKEYYENELIFEGEFLNGKKWNGKTYSRYSHIIYELREGKGYIEELDHDNLLVYKGEYSNGKRNGKGKEYNMIDGHLIFEGEYFNGKRWSGKGYYGYNELKKGKGYVKDYDSIGFPTILIFEGEYLNGEKNGKGKEYNCFNGSLKFEGQYLYGKRNGKGKEFDEYGNLIFEGDYLNDKKWNGKVYDYLGNLINEFILGSTKDLKDDDEDDNEKEVFKG